MTTVPSGIWPIDPNVTTGTDLATYLNTWMNAFQSMQASPTRPPLIAKGGIWAKTLGTADIALMFYDGAADHTIGSVIGGVVSFGGGVVASTTAPTPATLGDTWVDTSVAGKPVLNIFDGTVWNIVGPDATGTINAKALTVNGNNYPSAGALSNRNILINGNLTINQRFLSIASVATGAYAEDRWKKTAGGMTQIIEEANYLPSTVYTLSGTNVTTQQITSPASGNWTLPDIPVTARLVQLEQGDTATPFEHRSYGEEIALCERYYTTVTVHAQAPVAGFMYVPWYTTHTMRATPTLTVAQAGTNNGAVPTVDGISNQRGGFFQIHATPAGGGVTGRIYRLAAEL